MILLFLRNDYDRWNFKQVEWGRERIAIGRRGGIRKQKREGDSI